jgi:hypothetical protein
MAIIKVPVRGPTVSAINRYFFMGLRIILGHGLTLCNEKMFVECGKNAFRPARKKAPLLG